MKKSYIVAIVTFVIVCGSMLLMHKYATNQDVLVDEPVVEVPTVDELDIPQIDDLELETEESDIGFEVFTSTYTDEKDEILVNCSVTLPKSDDESEFSDNFNEYYAKILAKAETYRDFEGSDIAEAEKTVLEEDFLPVIYTVAFEIMYEDDEIVSIKRETTMYSNETDFYQIATETFSKLDGTLILVTDICSDFSIDFEEYFEVTLSSYEDFRFNVTSEGIWCKNDEIDDILPYSELNLAENYTYLGENNATD
ncbi:MAG: hypothetical protein R3Y09_04410 [Clostridia bacterium]